MKEQIAVLDSIKGHRDRREANLKNINVDHSYSTMFQT